MGTQRYSLPIAGMHCAACVTRLERVLGRLPQVAQAEVNLATERAELTVDGQQAALEPLIATVEKAGFSVPTEELHLRVEGMTCAACSTRLEKALHKYPEVIEAEVSLASEFAKVRFPEGAFTTAKFKQAVKKAGFEPKSLAEEAEQEKVSRQLEDLKQRKRAFYLSLLFTAPLVAPMLAGPYAHSLMPPGIVQLLLTIPVQFYFGARFYRGAWGAVKAKSPNMDVLVVLGTTAAFMLSVVQLILGSHELYFESSAAIVSFVLLGKWLEGRAKYLTHQAVSGLSKMRPAKALVKRGDNYLEEGLEVIAVGDLVKVSRGQRIPLDAVIVEGRSEVDESVMTGESLPVSKQVKDSVLAGTLNQAAPLTLKVSKRAEDSTLSQMVLLMQRAQAEKAPIQATVDKVSAVFVPIVLLISLATLAGWLVAGATLSQALIYAVAVLVIACPCALGLATPTALVVATGVAAREGLLLRQGAALQRSSGLKAIAFDKTGTLTEGRLQLSQIVPVGVPEPELLEVVYGLQLSSEHPLAKAVRHYAESKEMSPASFGEVEEIAGKGLRALKAKQEYFLGSRRLIEEQGITISESVAQQTNEELSWIYLARQGELLGTIGFQDTLRAEAKETIEALKSRQLKVIVISGDSSSVVSQVAAQLGVDSFHAEVLPHQKHALIKQLQSEYGAVAMVGDGINDAPALAAAEVSFAMAEGTDIAGQAAGWVMMRSDLRLVLTAIDLSRATQLKIKQNLFWAFIYNTLGLPLAAAGLLVPALAGGAMALSSVSVVSNALILRRFRSLA